MNLLTMKGVSKSFGGGPILRGVDLALPQGEMAALVGPSGAGKSTLLSIMGFLEAPDAGDFMFRDRPVGRLSDRERTAVRRAEIGFVFQAFHLLPRLSVLENVELPLLYQGLAGAERRRRAAEALERVGLLARQKDAPSRLSGGEQQRVAVARALAKRPALLLADEPTGNLDSATGAGILELFKELRRGGATVLIVTHDAKISAQTDRQFRISDGRLAA